MDTIDSLAETLNTMLTEQNFEANRCLELLEKLKTDYNLKFILIDLQKFNEASLSYHQQNKLEAARIMNFENAAWHRTMEDKCKEYIDLKNTLDVSSPMFISDGGVLFFFCFGDGEKEDKIKGFFQKCLEKPNTV
jgi:hypothetical protein